jgi:hypothetical protein
MGTYWELDGNILGKMTKKKQKNPGLTFLWMKKSCKALLLLHVDEEILEESSYG